MFPIWELFYWNNGCFSRLGTYSDREQNTDNLCAAVTRTDCFDPELNAKTEEFCRHYGTVMLPTRPAMPRHKGKIESGINYGQENALKGWSFESLAAQNVFLLDWETGVADTRINGATRQQVGKVFQEVERSKLLPLPPSLFPVFEEALRTVHRDGYIELHHAYYFLPPEYVGRQLWVRWESRLVRVFNRRREVIAVYVWSEPGKFTTDPNHVHSPHRRVIQQSLDYLLDRARLIGKQTGSWAEAIVQQRGLIGMRVLHGLLSLADKHPVAALEGAAEKVFHHGTCRLREARGTTTAGVSSLRPPDLGAGGYCQFYEVSVFHCRYVMRLLLTFVNCRAFVVDCQGAATSTGGFSSALRTKACLRHKHRPNIAPNPYAFFLSRIAIFDPSHFRPQTASILSPQGLL